MEVVRDHFIRIGLNTPKIGLFELKPFKQRPEVAHHQFIRIGLNTPKIGLFI